MNNPTHLTTARWHLTNRSQMPWGADVSEELLELLNDRLGYAPPGMPEEPIAPLPAAGCEQLVALCLGHARASDAGVMGAGGIYEEDFNSEFMDDVGDELLVRGIRVIRIKHYEGRNYSQAMTWLAKELLSRGATAAVEFHFNAANAKARGHEVLHWKGSVRGVTLAACILAELNKAFPKQPNRGLKPRVSTDRGALFLSLPHCPSVITEPFFGDQVDDWRLMSKAPGYARLVQAHAAGIANWIKQQEGCSK